MDFLTGKVASALLPVGHVLGDLAGIGQKQHHTSGNQPGGGYIHLTLAPCYGSLNEASIKKMDENTRVMIGTTITMLRHMNEHDRTWSNVVLALKTNPLLETVDGPGTHRSDHLEKKGSHDFKFDGSADPSTVREIVTWFRRLVADEDILNTMKINIEELAKITAQTGATVTSVASFFGKDQDQSKTVLDIGALRYPDLSNPYFKVYRIKVTAWSHSHRILFHQEDSNGVLGDFDCCRFRPRPAAIAALKKETIALAIKTAEDSLTRP